MRAEAAVGSHRDLFFPSHLSGRQKGLSYWSWRVSVETVEFSGKKKEKKKKI